MSGAPAPVDGERRLDLRDLVTETIAEVEAHPLGWRLRFASGVVIHVNRGQTYDAAGREVIEP